MEIKMIECPNGHYYNAAVHASCPECAKGTPAGQGNFSKTMPLNGAAPAGQGSFPKTTPPNAGASGPAAMGRTMPVNNRNVPAGGPATPFGVPTEPGGDLAADSEIDPVVGWLVCIDGPVRGVDFRLHSGYNYIGREEGDIHIHGDNQISRQKHAVVSFYAKRQTFHVGPADGRNIIELNDEPEFNSVEMKSYDVLTVGSTKLMLVAMCGERFSWTEGPVHE